MLRPDPKVQRTLEWARLQSEKCELKASEQEFRHALTLAQSLGDLAGQMEALAGLLKLANEALDEAALENWSRELDRAITAAPQSVPPMIWYCKGAVARQRETPLAAQRYFHRYLCEVKGTREHPGDPEEIAKGYLMLAVCLFQRGCPERARWLAELLIRKCQPTPEQSYRSVQGTAQLVLAYIEEKAQRYDVALVHYQLAHRAFLGEHNWYYHLYVLYGYARLARLQKNDSQAALYLEFVEQACTGPEFGFLRKLVAQEQLRLRQEKIDLSVDARKAMVTTRENPGIRLGNQHLLLQILEELTRAHQGGETGNGLSKAEIIERVWKEKYRPEAHDNKLYYNINRLRKLIEPDTKHPQYLLNWREGYRLAPGLRVRLDGISSTAVPEKGHTS